MRVLSRNWKRATVAFCLTASIGLISSCSNPTQAVITDQDEPHQGWVNLFNGKNLENWTVKINHFEVGDNFADTFRVENGILKVRYDQYQGDFNKRFGHLYYNTPFSNYHLIVEYRFVDKWYPSTPNYAYLNSGVMLHSQDPNTILKEQDWPIAVELQFLAGLNKDEPRPTGNVCTPGTDIKINGKQAKAHCIRANAETYYGDQWITAEAIVRADKSITHIINGRKVLEYTHPTIGGGVVNGADPHIKIDGKALTQGYIGLQSEGQPIDFRVVKIKQLDPSI